MSVRSSQTHNFLHDVFPSEKVMYVCKHSGPLRESTGNSERPHQHQNARHCPAAVTVVLSKCPCFHYKVTKVEPVHSHPIGPEYYKFYPENRVLTAEEGQHFADLFASRISTKDLKLLVSTKTGKSVLSMDIQNLKQEYHTHIRDSAARGQLLLQQIDKLSTDIPGCRFHVQKSGDGKCSFHGWYI